MFCNLVNIIAVNAYLFFFVFKSSQKSKVHQSRSLSVQKSFIYGFFQSFNPMLSMVQIVWFSAKTVLHCQISTKNHEIYAKTILN